MMKMRSVLVVTLAVMLQTSQARAPRAGDMPNCVPGPYDVLIDSERVTSEPTLYGQVVQRTYNERVAITCILVVKNDPSQEGTATIVAGGLGTNFATVQFTAPPAYSIDDNVFVYGYNGP